MRDILFRGKRNDNGEWVQGFYANELYSNKHYIQAWYYGSYAELQSFEIIPETVGQYTGLTDKNGKKIFEGDIIKRMWNGSLSIYQVVFDEYTATFYGEAKTKFTTFDGDGEWFEVIGNIHDNPELLEGRGNG